MLSRAFSSQLAAKEQHHALARAGVSTRPSAAYERFAARVLADLTTFLRAANVTGDIEFVARQGLLIATSVCEQLPFCEDGERHAAATTHMLLDLVRW